MFYLDVHILFLEHKESNLERATWVLEVRKGKEIHYIISIDYILKTLLYRKETNSFFQTRKAQTVGDESELGLFPEWMQHSLMDPPQD